MKRCQSRQFTVGGGKGVSPDNLQSVAEVRERGDLREREERGRDGETLQIVGTDTFSVRKHLDKLTLYRAVALLVGADADGVVEREHKDLSVADLAGPRGLA